MDFIFEWKNISRASLRSTREIFLPLEDKIHIFWNRVMFFLLYERRTSFCDFLKFSENLRKSSEIFGNLRKCSENDSKVIFR